MTLQIDIKSANITHDTEMWGDMNLFVIVKDENGKQFYQTQKKLGKKQVTWENQIFKCAEQTFITFELMDKETVKSDDFVGSGRFYLSQIEQEPYQLKRKTVKLQWEDKNKMESAGELFLEVEYNQAQIYIGSSKGFRTQLNLYSSKSHRTSKQVQPVNSAEPQIKQIRKEQPKRPVTLTNIRGSKVVQSKPGQIVADSDKKNLFNCLDDHGDKQLQFQLIANKQPNIPLN